MSINSRASNITSIMSFCGTAASYLDVRMDPRIKSNEYMYHMETNATGTLGLELSIVQGHVM